MNGVVCSNTLFSNTSALTSSLLFRGNSTCKILEHLVWSNTSGFQFWGPLARTNFLSALCGLPISGTDMTGRPGYSDNGNDWKKFRVVPRLYPLRSLVCTLFNKGGSRGAFGLPGTGGDHFHCAVEPSPSHIRCRPLNPPTPPRCEISKHAMTSAYNCHHFAPKMPSQKRPKGHKCAQLQTIVHECLKPPFESPHLDFRHKFFIRGFLAHFLTLFRAFPPSGASTLHREPLFELFFGVSGERPEGQRCPKACASFVSVCS